MTVFVVAVATIIVMELSSIARFDTRQTRAFTEGIQALYTLKSSLNLARELLEMKKQEGVNEDWLGEPWSNIAAAPSFSIPGVKGETRLLIVDDEGKIELNSSVSAGTPGSNFPTGATLSPTTPEGSGNQDPTLSSPSIFWKNALTELFGAAGFARGEAQGADDGALGGQSYSAADQVAIIDDWIDPDKRSFSSAAFDGEGIESSPGRNQFFNRKLRTLSELLRVPGMSADRLRRIAPFVRVSPNVGRTSPRVNVNTAPREVLLALGFPEFQVNEMLERRVDETGRITQEVLNLLVEGDLLLKNYTKVTSNEFSVYSRVTMPNSTRWLHAILSVGGSGNRRTTRVLTLEYY